MLTEAQAGPRAEGARTPPLSDSSSRRAWWTTYAAAVFGLVLLVVLRVASGPLQDLAFVVVTGGAAVVAWAGARRQPRAQRAPWLLIAAGVGCSAIADVLYLLVTAVQGAQPDISWADPFWLCSYAAVAAGVLLLQIGRAGRWPTTSGALDLAAVGILSLLLVWQLSVASTLGDESLSAGVRVLWAAYPILDALLLALVLQRAFSGEAWSRSSALLAGGVSCWLVSDFLYLDPAVATSIAGLLDGGWMVGAALLGAATWPPSRRPAAVPEDLAPVALARPDLDGRLERRMAVVGLLPLLVPGLVELWGFYNGENPHPLPLFLATALLTGVAFLRARRLIVSERRQRARLVSSERYYRALSANSSDAVVVLDERGVIVDGADAVASLIGSWSEDDEAAADPFGWVHPDEALAVGALVERLLASPGLVADSEVRVRDQAGETRWLASRAANLLHDPDVGGIVINLRDVTDRRRVELELAHQAFHDSLTGLANRALFSDRLEQLVRRMARTGGSAAVVYLDLDGFKTINDSLGHEAGDEVLCEVAERIRGAVRAGDTVARLGGDEFAIVTEEGQQGLDEAIAVAQRVLEALAVPVEVEGHHLQTSASVGIALADEDSSTSSVLRNADVAMYRAKAQGKGRWIVYEPSMRLAVVERLQVEEQLGRAVERGQLHLVHQPVLAMGSGRTVGFESLLRWDHPERGVIQPDRFVPVAEETGLIVPIGRWVLEEACAAASRWASGGTPVSSVAVNVSARQLDSGTLVQDVAGALERSGLSPACLVLEVTETALVEFPRAAAAELAQLRTLGVRLAIDDFGTGYSSLGYLREIPVDILKIDRSFVSTIEDPGETPAILRGLIDLGRTLGLELVAEGIEDEVQLHRLRAEHCDLGQGFLFSPPLSEADAAARLRQEASPDARASFALR